MDIVNPAIEEYMKSLTAADNEPVLLEMERVAEEKGFPIIGRLCGRYLEIQARMISARRIFELGSGYGYSAYWFSRATGSEGEIHLTDTDPKNRDQALDYLSRAGLADPVQFHVSDAVQALDEVDREFDIVYCDINKGDYPEAWQKGRERVRVGGLYMCDNMLWSGRVISHPEAPAEVADGWTEAITQTNEMIFGDGDFRATINPTRDGVITALRVR